MQPDVHPHVVLDLHGDLGRAPVVTLVTLLGLLRPLYIRPNHVAARRHKLLKFPRMIGVHLPAGFLLTGRAYFNPHTVDRLIIRAPNSPEDQASVFGLSLLVTRRHGGARPGKSN